MRCPKCHYFFSEELKTCPRCGADMGSEIEKLGLFPKGAEEPFLTPEDFIETSYGVSLEAGPQERTIDFPFPEETT